MPHIAIVGGSDAGVSAALRARQLDPDTQIGLYVADSFPNFSVCGIPFYISREVDDWRRLAHRTAEDIEAAGIDLALGAYARLLDPAAKRLTLARDGAERSVAYDQLLIATGATPVAPPIDGLDRPGVFFMRSMGDCLAFDAWLENNRPQRALVVGGGYIGLEMADALRLRGLEVTILEHGPTVMQTVDPTFAGLLQDELRDNGVDVKTDTKIVRLHHQRADLVAEDDQGNAHRGDVALIGAGARPNVHLAEAAGVPLTEKGAIVVDRAMQTPLPAIYAAGDCARSWNALLADWTYQPLGTTAHKQGRIAGENMAGGDRLFAGTLGTQVVKVFGLVVGRTGLRREEAKRAGFSPVAREVLADDHKAYYPGARPLRIGLVADGPSGRLLGAQMIGAYGAEIAKRIDVFATVIFNRMTVHQIDDLDLAYTPPLGSPWDALQMAAQGLSEDLRTAS